jgi:DNA helicase-2/ATP-dependent DNA helicase PcrA
MARGIYNQPMRIVADLHIHSRYSLATSSKLKPTYLDRWARIKGIDLIGTGDCTHPAWLSELRESLEPAEEGLFRLKAETRRAFDSGEALAAGLPEPWPARDDARGALGDDDPAAAEIGPRFVLSGEISTIYSRDGRTRKIHHLVILPDFAAAAAFQARLERVGNISSDGRPILGIDSRELFSLLLDADDRSILVPAHIWTPWFSALGARSGFDSIDECYGDLAPRIGAIETGLSSNPPMNWAVSSLDRFAIISNSDAHSPEKLGREATILDTTRSFAGLAAALAPLERAGGERAGRVARTIEFFPQEGKYHYDGHRACGVVMAPDESAQRGGICPVCGKHLTPGVLGRVAELADRPVDESATCPAESEGTNRRPYCSLIPLPELLAELLRTGAASKRVAAAYGELVSRSGSEFALLLDQSEAEIEARAAGGIAGGISGELLAEAVGRMRSGRVSITPGYDGEYGVIRAFAPGERFEPRKKETELFGEDTAAEPLAHSPPSEPSSTLRGRKPFQRKGSLPRAPSFQKPASPSTDAPRTSQTETAEERAIALDAAQEAVVHHPGGPALVIAGPGTGKTAVLALRAAKLVEEGFPPASILALTFTNKAAESLRDRIRKAVGDRQAGALTATTFHSLCLAILRERAAEAGLPEDFTILDESDRRAMLAKAAGGEAAAHRLGVYIEARKRFLLLPGEREPRLGPEAPPGLLELAAELGLPDFDEAQDQGYATYRASLKSADALDFDDLVAGTARLFAARPETLAAYRDRFRAIFVDEYQDLNFAQYALMRLLAPDGAELCAIGDPNQAIYGFRGSDRRFIERFREDYPTAILYRLTRSFRCAPAIVGAAGRLAGVELGGSGSAVALFRSEYPTDKSEAEGVAREIDRLIGGTRFFAMDSGVALGEAPALRSLGECAILVRAAALAPPFEKALLDHGIPFMLVGERPWWEDEPTRSILASLREQRPSLAPAEALRVATDRLVASKAISASEAQEARERLAGRAASYGDLMPFLDDLALASPQDGYEPSAERVSLMTVHAAKGLEFDYVFVVGLEEGILPFTLFERQGKAGRPDELLASRIEEERRILYVAMTRARLGLYLSWAKARSFRGRSLALPPSRFLAEIEDLVPLLEREAPKPRDPQLGLF